MMSHEQKLAFVHKMTKTALEHVAHFDQGGGVLSAGSSGAGIFGGLGAGLTTQNGYQAQAPTSAGTVGAQQGVLAGELQNEAAGNGPNPAQTQYLANAQKIAGEQASNYAANRSLNPGLAARMAGDTAASTEQTAAAGAAAQQAEQQLAAQKELGALTGQEQQGALQAQGINSQVAQNNTNSVNQTTGGIISGVGSALEAVPAMFGLAKGGPVKKMASGGSIFIQGEPNLSNANLGSSDHSGASSAGSHAGKFLSGLIKSPAPTTLDATDISPDVVAGGADTAAELAPVAALAAKGGKVNPKDPKEKATVKGDSYSNDKVPALLSQGEFVIDRQTMQDPGPLGKMARTLAQHIQSKNGKKKVA